MDKKKRKYSGKETFIAESCIFDDEYMKLYFGNEVEITQLVLRIILDNDSLIIFTRTSAKTEVTFTAIVERTYNL